MRPGGFARRFIAGEALGDALTSATRLTAGGRHCTLNHLGESVRSLEAAREAVVAYEIILQGVREAGLSCQISMKLTQLGLLLDPRNREENLRRVLDAAGDTYFVRIDMEQSFSVDPTLDLFERVWRAGYRNVGVVLQAYLHRTADDLKRLIDLGAGVRLCKGAYQESAAVAYPAKSDVDTSFVRLMRTLVDSGTRPAFATHDPRMIEAVKTYAHERGLSADAFEFEMLFGVPSDLQTAIAAEGYRVRVSLPSVTSGFSTSCGGWESGPPTCCSY